MGAPGARAATARGSIGGGGGQVFQPGAGIAFAACAAEQPGVGGVGGAGDIGAGDMQ